MFFLISFLNINIIIYKNNALIYLKYNFNYIYTIKEIKVNY